MCSTRNAFVLLAVGLVVFAGCQRIVPPPMVSPVNNPPTVIDQGTQLRNFEQSTSYYASGASIAGGTSYLWQIHETMSPGSARYLEVPVALLNVGSMPVGVFIEAPWENQVNRGESVPPTYTAQPPLP